MSANDVLRSLLETRTDKKLHGANLLQANTNITRPKQATLSNGRRITLKPRTTELDSSIFDMRKEGTSGNGYHDMDALWEKLRIEEKTTKELSEFDSHNRELEQGANELRNLSNKRRVNTLWTEKYRPNKFIDLIGNEKTNAHILKWLNDWTYVVKGGKLIDSNTYGRDMNIDPLKRPRKKVLLIHGPPGIGKTTIAQCVCKQLGYEMHEINSSDERSGPAVKDKVQNAIKMRSLSGKDVCLLLDEIDGAVGSEGGFIRVLINLLQKDLKATEEWNSFSKLKYHKKEHFIRRPIIAMCNDIGARCLDQLKPYCEVVSFKKSSKKSIKKRLKMILESEKVGPINESLLDDLIISLDGDIRNCINFLQLNSKNLNGRIKDSEIVWFQLLKEIFNLENQNIRNKKGKNVIFKELMIKLSNSSSDLTRINNGCFNLMLQLNDEYDNNLKKLDEASDWLYFQDIISKNNTLFDKEELHFYEAVTPLRFFQLFANFTDGQFYDKNARFNFKSQDNFELRKQVNEMISTLLKGYKLRIDRKVLITNEISMLNYIVVPNVSKTAKEFSKDDKKVERVLEILNDLSIRIETYNGGYNGRGDTNVNENGQRRTVVSRSNTYKFKPDIVIGLIDCNSTNKTAAESDWRGYGASYATLTTTRATPFIEVLDEVYRTSLRKHQEANKILKREREKNVEDPEVAKKRAVSSADYFIKQYNTFHSQLHKNEANGGISGRGVMAENENRILVKYHEGFSNAVRKELVWNSLFK